MVDRLGPDGVLIADETGFVKKGTGSAGESTNAEAMLHRSLNVNERRRIAYEAATGEIIVFAQTGGATWHGYVVTWHGSSSTT
ncbi:hypothetical protein GCM10009733_107150 [Nonomuraea maheshkhaliensis]|uniref:Transposase IS701-like DDE domain-containing protein n=1 Tax=Nonomuraea maheshkhaliensis TaxID=419590 RepID=A0ABN2HUS8_9ACTN